jgi:cobalt-zinc-cadmium efflux system membrane fusion protein
MNRRRALGFLAATVVLGTAFACGERDSTKSRSRVHATEADAGRHGHDEAQDRDAQGHGHDENEHGLADREGDHGREPRPGRNAKEKHGHDEDSASGNAHDEHDGHADDHERRSDGGHGHGHQEATGHTGDEEHGDNGGEHHGHDHDDAGSRGHDHDEGGGHGHEEDEHADRTVRLTAGQMAYFGVTVAQAGPGSVDLGVYLPGEIRPNGDRLAHIVPRFPGIVRDVRKNAGDRVEAGDILAVIESSESLARYELKTLIAGTVIEKHLTLGEAVDREEQAFVIADLATVWVDLSVYQKDLLHVRTGQAVHIGGGPGLPEATGTISYITPIVDQPTRTATARVVLPNPEGIWRPGMFVNAHALDPVPADIVVPRSAMQLVEQAPVVFVQTEDGFEPRPITIGRAGDTHVEIVQGLDPGERYVATNSFLLKAELGKSEAGHAH